MLNEDYILGALNACEGFLSAMTIIEKQTQNPKEILRRLENTLTGTIEELKERLEDTRL